MTQRQQQKTNTREKVVSAARALFRTHGFAGAGIRDVAAAAGVSTGAVFTSFTDKRDLWHAAMGRDETIDRALWGEQK